MSKENLGDRPDSEQSPDSEKNPESGKASDVEQHEAMVAHFEKRLPDLVREFGEDHPATETLRGLIDELRTEFGL